MMRHEPPVTPLRSDQQAAATAPIGPVLISGGAGSGKSHTIAARIAIWVKNGESPFWITCLTHSPGGADFITQTVDNFLPRDCSADGLSVTTPQGLSLEVLQPGGMEVLGRSADFTVWQRDDSVECIAGWLQANRRDRRSVDTDARRIERWHWLNRSRFPNERIPPDDSQSVDAIDAYEEEKRLSKALDHADLVDLATLALERNKPLRDRFVRWVCRHLLVDDLQDFSPAEYMMIRQLTSPERAVTVAANFNETVRTAYGADDRVLGLFKYEFLASRGKTYSLAVNHRLTKRIGELVDRLTADPALRLRDETQVYFRTRYWAGTSNVPMSPPELMVFEGRPVDMCRTVLDRTEKLVREGYDLQDIACVYQDPSLLGHLRLLAVSRGWDYTVLGDGPRPRDRDVQCVLGLFASVLNPKDISAMRRGAGIGPQQDRQMLDRDTAIRIAQMAESRNVTLPEAARIHCNNPLIDRDLRPRLEFFVDAWDALDRLLRNPSTQVADLCSRAVSLLEEAQGAAHPVRSKAQVATLQRAASDHSFEADGIPVLAPRIALQQFLHHMNPDVYDDPLSLEKNEPVDRGRGIIFSTVAASRGLEWPVVWALGASDHILPGTVVAGDDRRMRDAERLFYVWSTRARDRLIYCHAVRSGPTGNAQLCRFLPPVGDLLRQEVVPASDSRR